MACKTAKYPQNHHLVSPFNKGELEYGTMFFYWLQMQQVIARR